MLDYLLKQYPTSHEADSKTKEVIKVLNKFEKPGSENGHCSYTIMQVLLNTRTVYEYKDYFLISMNSNISYCKKEEI